MRMTENEWKNDFELPPYLKLGNLEKYDGKCDDLRCGYGFLNNNENLNENEIQKVKSMTDRKIIVKGIMCIEDALFAVRQGADAIWISDGGHQKTSYTPSTIDVLEPIVKALKGTNT